MIYWAHVRAADEGSLAPTHMDLSTLLDCCLSTPTHLEQKMETKGWIKVDRYQRGRRVTIMSTGKSTKEPQGTAPHWRTRPEHQLEPMALLRARHPDVFQQIVVGARRERKSVAAYTADLIARSIQAATAQG
jgi:hypothetical protein